MAFSFNGLIGALLVHSTLGVFGLMIVYGVFSKLRSRPHSFLEKAALCSGMFFYAGIYLYVASKVFLGAPLESLIVITSIGTYAFISLRK